MTGKFSKIRFGDGLTVTDEGGGVIRVDGGAGGGGGDGGTEYAYVEVTADVSITAGSYGSSQEIVSAGTVTYPASRIKVEFYAADVTHSGGGACHIYLWDGPSSSYGKLATFWNNAGAVTADSPIYVVRYMTPTAGSHTFRVVAWMTGGSVIVRGGFGGSDPFPIWIRITSA